MLKLFYMDIGCGCSEEQSQAFYSVLPDERRERIERMKNRELAAKRILTDSFMQYGICRVMGISLGDIRYSYGEQGKPFLDTAVYGGVSSFWQDNQGNGEWCRLERMEFNLSHSGKYAVLAMSDKPVGVDVERGRKNRLSVAERCFHEREYADIMSAKGDREKEQKFLEYWTMKEAYVKWTGEGLSCPFRSFCVERQGEGISLVRDEKGIKVWFATSFLADDGYAVSVCSKAQKDIMEVRSAGQLQVLAMEEVVVEEMLEAFVS